MNLFWIGVEVMLGDVEVGVCEGDVVCCFDESWSVVVGKEFGCKR